MFAFLSKNKRLSGLTAVDLHADGICIAQVAPASNGRPKVTGCAFHPWEGAADVHAKQLASLAADYDLKRVRCTTVLNDGEYKILLTEAPDVPADELKAAVRWRVKDLIDFHVNDAAIDVFNLPGEHVRGRARSVYAVVARNQTIQERADLMTKAGINLDVIDIPELAQRNLVSLLPEDANGMAFLSLQATTGLITITKQGELYMSRSVDVGFDLLQQAGDPVAYFDRIVLEVQRSLDYFDSHFRQAPISHLILAPLSVQIPGLIDHLNNNLNLKASMLDLEQCIELKQPVPPPVLVKCLTTIGAALRVETKAL